MSPAGSATLHGLLTDDEPSTRERISPAMKEQQDAEMVATDNDGPAVVTDRHGQRPNVAFLAGEMPGRTAPDVMEEIGAKTIPVRMLVTADTRGRSRTL